MGVCQKYKIRISTKTNNRENFIGVAKDWMTDFLNVFGGLIAVFAALHEVSSFFRS